MNAFPTSLPHPVMVPLDNPATLRWGIMAPGEIAGDFTSALHHHTRQRVEAVASRSQQRASAFAGQYDIPRAYASYELLAADDAIDIVYISAPNSEHARLAHMAIDAGKHVLVEKPMAASSAEAAGIIDAAHSAGVFAMEAMWSAFLPQTSIIRQLLADGVFGDISVVTADFGADFSDEPNAIVFQPELAGGVLRDIGIYALWFSSFVLGSPETIDATGSVTASGVDEQVAMVLGAAAGAQSVLYATMRAATPVAATINGAAGRMEVHSPFLMPSGFTLYDATSDRTHDWRDPSGLQEREGLAWQAAAVAQHVHDGLLESPLHPWHETVAILQTLDEARTQVCGQRS